MGGRAIKGRQTLEVGFDMTFLFIALVLLVFGYLYYRYTYWSRQGVPSPNGNLLYGHLGKIESDYCFFETLYNYGKEVGSDTYGLLIGGRRILITSNIDLIHEIYMTQFDNFNAGNTDFFIVSQEKKNLALATGKNWKRMKNVVVPFLTTQFVKSYEENAHLSVRIALEGLERGGEVNTRHLMSRVFSNAIVRVMFGCDIPHLEEETIRLTHDHFARESLWTDPIRFGMAIVSDSGPLARWLARRFDKHTQRHFGRFKRVLLEVVEKQIPLSQIGGEYADSLFGELLQVDVPEEEEIQNGKFNLREKVKAKLTFQELVSQVVVLLIGGSDTTASTVTRVMRDMALYPEIQKKAQEEIDKYVPSLEDCNFENAYQIEYLEWIVRESNRTGHASLIGIQRRCLADTVVGNGIQMRTGDFFGVNMKELHESKELWGENPEKYVPERWDTSVEPALSRPASASLMFGYGARYCVGKNFAMYFMKYVISRILKEYSVERTAETPTTFKGVFGTNSGPVPLKFVRRKF